jgi:hypothetical protein
LEYICEGQNTLTSLFARGDGGHTEGYKFLSWPSSTKTASEIN